MLNRPGRSINEMFEDIERALLAIRLMVTANLIGLLIIIFMLGGK
jgi:hypothetical protein